MKLNDITHVAVFRALQFGDFLCAVPAWKSLREALPNAKITYIGLPHSKPLAERFHHLFDQFIAFPGYPGLPEQGFNEDAFDQFCTKVKEQNYDLILQMQGNGSIVNKMLGQLTTKYLAGFSIDDDEILANPLLLRYPNFGHETNRHLSLMRHLGFSDVHQMEFPINEVDLEHFEALKFPWQEQTYVCIHPGSRGAWRQWPLTYFAALANICTDHGLSIVLTGVETEMDLITDLAKQLKQKPTIMAGRTNLGSLGVLVKNAALLISNCTGVSHLAAALKTPSLVISMDGEMERWAAQDQHLHYTVDWTKAQNYEVVKTKLEQLLTFVKHVC